MTRHPSDASLALYATGDLDLRERWLTGWHLRACVRCAALAKAYASDAAFRRESAQAMPLPGNWDELAEEMAANIRVGLAASECIREVRGAGGARPPGAVRPGWFWKPAAGVAAAMAMVLAAWVSTMPPEQARVFSRVWDAVAHGRGGQASTVESVVLESSSGGIEMRRGSRTSLKVLVTGQNPDQFSANLDGSLRAQYVDDQSGQVTVTNVYAQ